MTMRMLFSLFFFLLYLVGREFQNGIATTPCSADACPPLQLRSKKQLRHEAAAAAIEGDIHMHEFGQ